MKRVLRLDPRIRCKKADIPIDLPVIIKVTDFNETGAKNFSDDMQKAHEVDQPIIPVVIDSYGGQVDALVSMISEIQNATIPVATICQGKAMSCGSILLSCGAPGYRYCDINSRIMIHDVSNMAMGKNEEIKAEASETDRLSKLVFHLMSANCEQPKNYFLDMIHEKNHAEWYLTAKEARKINLVNHIYVPTMTVNVNVDIQFG